MEIENIPNEKTSKKRPCDCRGVLANICDMHSFTRFARGTDDFRFEDLRFKINPHSGANGNTAVVDTLVALTDVAINVDVRRAILEVAR